MKFVNISTKAIGLIFPPSLFILLNYGFALVGQSKEYWRGDYSLANDLSPSFSWLLSIHPMAYVFAIFIWLVCLWISLLLLPQLLSQILSLTITIGYTAGAWSWLVYSLHLAQIANLLFFLAAIIIVYSLKNLQNSDYPILDWQKTGLPDFVRWFTIVILLSFPVWWFIFPR